MINENNKRDVIIIHVDKGENKLEYEKFFTIFKNINQEFKKSLDSFKKIYMDTLEQYKISLILIKQIGEMTISKELIENFEELKNSLEKYKNLANEIKKQSDDDLTSKLIEKRPSNIFELKSLIEQLKKIRNFFFDKTKEVIKITNENEIIQKKIISMSNYPIKDIDKNYIFNKMKVIKYDNLNLPLNKDITKLKECVICLNDFKRNDYLKVFSCGKHIFHEKCLSDWLKNSVVCPLCKYNMKLELIKFNLLK